MSKALVTGGTGFIGSALTAWLLKNDWDVTVVDNMIDPELRTIESHGNGHFKLLPIDVCEIGNQMWAEKFDWVFHFAGHYANVRSLQEPKENVTTNMVGTMAVLAFCKANNIKNLMYASSSGVYGAMDVVAYAENSQPRPSTPYECTKYGGELLCIGWGEIFGMSILAPRFFNVYGPGDLPGEYRAVIPNFFKKALAGESITITGKTASRDFTYIDDVIDAIMAGVQRLEETPAPLNLVYNIATGRETFISKLAEMIVELTDSKSPISVVDKRFWDNAPRRVGDVHKFRALFPEHADRMRHIDQGLKDSLEWYKEVAK